MSFTLTRLESLHDLNNDVDQQSKFAKNGMSRKRVKDAAQNPSCDCGCVIPAALLYKVCCAFWTLGKCAQDALLWSLQTEGGRKQIKYTIEGPFLTKHFVRNSTCQLFGLKITAEPFQNKVSIINDPYTSQDPSCESAQDTRCADQHG